jgi:glycosyltransferase involved in cell wall biosynthesis
MIKKVLIIGYVWPEPNSSAAGQRMLQLINSFLNNQFEVVFATQAYESQYAFNLATLNIETFKIAVNDSSFDSFVKNQNPSIVMFDRFIMEEQFGWRVAEQCPNALRMLDTEDLHFLRKERQQKLNQKVEKETFSDIAKREIASIYRSDLTLIISEFEMELLTVNYQVPKERLMYLPMWSDSVSKINDFTLRKHFMFIGNFMHEPNWDCVRYLKSEIWPLIRKKLPDTELHIYGAYPTDKVFQLNNEKEGFIIKGRAEDVNEICQNYRLMIAPLRFGAGIKGKFIDAMRNGLPSITTTLGAESMIDTVDWPGYVSDEIEAMISNASEIYSNELRWNELSEKAFKIHNEKFTDKKWSEIFIEKVIDYIQNQASIRQNNFTGAMLMHHTQQSTKFMSKWIELKNQL